MWRAAALVKAWPEIEIFDVRTAPTDAHATDDKNEHGNRQSDDDRTDSRLVWCVLDYCNVYLSILRTAVDESATDLSEEATLKYYAKRSISLAPCSFFLFSCILKMLLLQEMISRGVNRGSRALV